MFARGRAPAVGTTPPPAPAPTPAPAPAPVRTPAPSSSAEDLRALLGFLRVTEADFAAHEARYFEALRNLLLRRGTIGANEAINRSTFRDTVRRF